MPPWLGTLIVLFSVALLLGGIVYTMIRDRKRGKGGCSCGCASCKMSCPTKQKTAGKSEKQRIFHLKRQKNCKK